MRALLSPPPPPSFHHFALAQYLLLLCAAQISFASYGNACYAGYYKVEQGFRGKDLLAQKAAIIIVTRLEKVHDSS